MLECPFCKADDIKYGALVCKHCNAEIEYETFSTDSQQRSRLFGFAASVSVFFAGVVAAALAEMPIFLLGALIVAPVAWYVARKLTYDDPTEQGEERVQFRRGRGGSVAFGTIFFTSGSE